MSEAGVEPETDHDVAARGRRDGYARLSPNYYGLAPSGAAALMESYDRLPADVSSPGNRERRFFHLAWNVGADSLVELPNLGYTQDYSDNSADGGKLRKFENIESQIMESEIIRRLVAKDAEIAIALGLFAPGSRVDIKLHQIRFHPTSSAPATSSPVGLHKDTELCVFLHVIGRSAGLTGGESQIAANQNHVIRLFTLQPLETLLLLRSVFHAVSPMGVTPGTAEARRDILLVTFQNAPEKPWSSGDLHRSAVTVPVAR